MGNSTLLNKLSKLPTLKGLKDEGRAQSRQGVVRGDRKKQQQAIVDRPMLEKPHFPDWMFLAVDPKKVPINTDPSTDEKASTNFEAFEAPQLLIKQSWTHAEQRFRAVFNKAGNRKGVLCTQSYLSVHVEPKDEKLLESACLVYNSSFALYWLYMTNHWLASFIANASVSDLLKLPLPDLKGRRIGSLADFDYEAVDEMVRESLGLDETDWSLISDFFNYTLPEFKRLPDAPGPNPTSREQDVDELERYCSFFLRTLGAAFGASHKFGATIFREDTEKQLSVRLAAIHLKPVVDEPIRAETISSPALMKRLQDLEQVLRSGKGTDDGIGFQRIGRIYSDYRQGRKSIPTLYLMKPDQVRYWTASAGMRDADDAFNEIMLWKGNGSQGEKKPEAK